MKLQLFDKGKLCDEHYFFQRKHCEAEIRIFTNPDSWCEQTSMSYDAVMLKR